MLQRHTPDDATMIDPSPSIAGRRALFAALVVTTFAGLLWLMAVALSVGGFSLIDMVILALFALTLPWTVIGFWNGTIGFLVMRLAADPTSIVAPSAARVRGDEKITSSTAILVCIRNEVPDRVIRNLGPMLDGLVAAGVADRFRVYVLSDTSRPQIAAVEDASFAALAAAWRGRIALTYRRRADNAGYKAGNIRDFCERFGHLHEFAVTLDADSVMPAAAILRLVRVMQTDPKLGILQGLVVGLPSTSAFARLFQFGMRLGMRSHTIGSAWWQGDCGPYWGHNAVVRLTPFIRHCALPLLPNNGPLGGHVLSHDQIEAVLMRRAGYEVRVLPEEELGWEENPVTLLEFIRRDLRWCQGNMQYWHFLKLAGLKPVSRYQIAFALIWFLASPAWIGLLIAGTAGAAIAGPGNFVRPDAGMTLFVIALVMWFAPKIASMIDVLLRAEGRRAFGGTARFLASVTAETAFSFLLTPIMWFGHTAFLIALLLGRGIGWIGQSRDDHAVPVRLALRQLWPQTVLGLACLGVLAATAPAALPYAFLIMAGGLVLSVPLAVITASLTLGRAMARIGLCRLPEETAPPPALRALALPAVEAAARPGRPACIRAAMRKTLRTARGVIRSLRIYYGDRRRHAAMDTLYRRFIAPHDLVFDIGAHVGDRIAAFRRLGARVVAVEPQPALTNTLWLIYGRDRCVTIEQAAVGRECGMIELKLNPDNPTVATASEDFIKAARAAHGWEGQAWTATLWVPVTTLDRLIADHGMPAFVKIDVEGFEAEVLAGLAKPVKSLSFEFTTIQRDVALAAIDRCAALGYASFDAALGESQTLVHGDWRDAQEIARWLVALPAQANSGDIYAILR